MKQIIVGLLACCLMAAQWVGAAESKIAVIDIQTAILSSEQAKERIAELKKEFAPEQNEIKELAQDIQKLQAKMEQDAAVMSESEKKKLAKDVEDKAVDYQFKIKKIQKSQNESQQELLAELSPKLEKAIQEIIAEGTYSLILERRAAIFVSPEHDITKKVTEKLNLNR